MLQLELAYEYKNEIKEMFTEYTDMLVEGDPEFKKYLDIQNYDAELEHLENKYGMPYGRLFILFCDGKPAGCVGLRKLDDENCEIKRLYVKPKFRGRGIGKFLAEEIVKSAEEIGYSHVLLDTLPFLKTAIGMYERMGFYRIESYNNSPLDTTIYMKLDLK